MKIKIVETEEDFLSLEQDWNKLTQNLITVNKFDWQYKWWKHFKNNNELKILIAQEDNKILGIAPLYIENTMALKFIPIKKLCFLGGKISDYLDFLIQDENNEAIFKSFLDYIFNNISYDLLELNQINSHYPNFKLWQKYSDSLNLNFTSYRKCVKVNLCTFNSYNDYFNQLSKNLKKDIKIRQNRTIREGAGIEYVFKKDITGEDLDIIADINIKRQKFLSQKGVSKRFSYFINAKNREFFKEYFCYGQSDSNTLAYMKSNGKIISYIMLFLDNGYVSYWNTAFDPDYEIYSPTKLLINEIIKFSFDNKFGYFDFMRGDDKYKLQWSNEISENHQLIKNKSLKAKIVFLYRNFRYSKVFKKIVNSARNKKVENLIEI